MNAAATADIDSAAGVGLAYPSLREQWPLVHAPVRAVHARRPIELQGSATVLRGRHPLARLIGWVARLPSAQQSAPVRVRIERWGADGEQWTRWFGRSGPMRSRLHPVGANPVGGTVEERIGLSRLQFVFRLEGGAIRWQAVAAHTLGVRWPASWLTGIAGFESVRDGRYYFHARLALPRIGVVADYVGTLGECVP